MEVEELPVPEKLSSSANKGERYTLLLTLHCTTDNSEVKRDFICKGNPDSVTVSEVKDYVEKEYQIPAHCQSLYFESTLLRDEDTLVQSWIREGDTIAVEYDTDADVNDVNEVVKTLKDILKEVERCHQSNQLDQIAQQGINFKRIRELIFTNFRDASKRSDANRLLFVHKDGVRTLFKLYSLILQMDYQEASFQIRYLESVLIQVIGSTLIDSSTRFPILRQLVLDNPTLEYTLKSFTRVLIPHRQRIEAPKGPTEQFSVPQEVQNQVLARCLQMSQVNTSK